DRLARRALAVHAGHRLMVHGWVVRLAFEIAVDANPVHLAADDDLGLSHHWDVVLGLACSNTGVAADARIEVDGHPPGVAIGWIGRVERLPACVGFGMSPLVCCACAGVLHPHRLTSLHRLMVLRACQRLAETGGTHEHATGAPGRGAST